METVTTGKLSYDDLTKLQETLDPAYRLNKASVAFAMNNSTYWQIVRVKDGDNRPLIVPGSYERGQADEMPLTAFGHPMIVDQYLPTQQTSGAQVNFLFFGDFSSVICRTAGGPEMFTFADEKRTATTASIELYAHEWFDSIFADPSRRYLGTEGGTGDTRRYPPIIGLKGKA